MIIRKEIPANVLPTVLVVTVLLMLGIAVLYTLFDAARVSESKLTGYWRNVDNVESGFTLYKEDSVLLADGRDSVAVRLYEDDPQSTVYIKRNYWGLYEVVTVQAADTSVFSIRMMGKVAESEFSAALYVPDRGKAVAVTGKSHIAGRICVSERGVFHSQFGSEFFSGSEIDSSVMAISLPNFPKEDAVLINASALLETLSDTLPGQILSDFKVIRRFTCPPLRISVIGGIISDRYSISGNVIITGDDIRIRRGAELTDVLVVCRRAIVEDGFAGVVQIMASDTVIAGRRVRLLYPSGIFLGGSKTTKLAELGEESLVEGYVVATAPDVVFAPSSDEVAPAKAPVYIQRSGAKVRGLVWIDGSAQIAGMVSGSLYVSSPDVYTSGGYHENTLHNVVIAGHDELPFPVVMASAYRRKEVKWLR